MEKTRMLTVPPFVVATVCLILAGCAAKPQSSTAASSTAAGATVRFGAARPLSPGTVVVHRERLVMTANMTVDGSEAVTHMDFLSLQERKTEVLAVDDYRIGWPRHRTRNKIDGETKAEASPLEGHTFRIAKKGGKLAVLDDNGAECTSELCNTALAEILSSLSAPPKKAGAGGGAGGGGTVLDLDAPMSVGQQFDDATALLGDPAAGMRFERTQATLDSADGGVARFGISGTIHFDLGALSMAVKFKGRLARRIADRALVEDAIAGPLTFDMKQDEVVVRGRGNLELVESWTWSNATK